MIARLAWAASCLAALTAATAFATSTERARLEDIETRIHDVQTVLGSDAAARERIAAELDALDGETRRAAAAERAARQAADRAAGELASLERQAAATQRRLAEQRALLARHVRALARLETDDPLRFLLGAGDPTQGARSLRNYRFVAAARAQVLAQVAREAERLAALERATAASHAKLADARGAAARQLARLGELIAARKRKAAELDRALSSNRQRLAALERERERLTALIEELARRQRAAGVPPLASRQGRLPWPVRGELTSRFGSAPPGGVRSTGWFIATPPGAPVYPVYPGRVAYADWFRGLGLLVIVDHGDANLTLYAHNQRLLAALDAEVGPDEPIALAGDSGNAERPGLYFELRIDGEPRNPADWLASHP